MQAYLRKATEEDMDLLYQWANDPEVRAYSFSVSEINSGIVSEWINGVWKDYSEVTDRTGEKEIIRE